MIEGLLSLAGVALMIAAAGALFRGEWLLGVGLIVGAFVLWSLSYRFAD